VGVAGRGMGIIGQEGKVECMCQGAVVGRREWLEGFRLSQQAVATKESGKAEVLSRSLCRRAGSQGPAHWYPHWRENCHRPTDQ